MYLFVGMTPKLLSNPKARCTSGFLISDCRKFKDGHNHFLEYCVILHKRLTYKEICFVNTPSAVSHNTKSLRPHKPMYFEQELALPHIHYTLGSL